MPNQSPHEGLQSEDEAKVDESQGSCQRTVNQRAIDKNIDIPEPGAQDGEDNGERDEKYQEVGGSEDDQVSKGAFRGK